MAHTKNRKMSIVGTSKGKGNKRVAEDNPSATVDLESGDEVSLKESLDLISHESKKNTEFYVC